MNRPTTAEGRMGLKVATREAVLESGGPHECAKYTRSAPSHISDYGNSLHTSFVPIDIAADLDMQAGAPVILRALAELEGYDLVPRTPVAVIECAVRLSGKLARESGELADVTIQAMQDGVMTRNEARDVLQEAADVRRVLEQIEIPALRVLAGNEGKVA